MVDDGLGGRIYPRHPPHTDEHVVDEVHWNKVCYPKLAVSADPQHSLSNLCKVRRKTWRGVEGRRRGEEERGEEGRRRGRKKGREEGERREEEKGGGEGGRVKVK